ncbi:hypothetical protein E1286_04920 [Nonomuraea terrae]|uniref:Uncharacterized protein n=1 Tax=Nonomuraea terrae TaxID=2530383 RepID=A0A4R4Z8N0_9ACTN|nr:hypothetical protein [Nonomuraea terrae]TDD54535.1 hypothetical protein E1286_04920 [Nonomuraea terrae]
MTRIRDELFDCEQAIHYLAALHFNGFTVTIHSPKTSPDGLYCVTAYGHKGKRNMVFRGSHARLHMAIRQAGRKLGKDRLQAYMLHSLDAGLLLLADQPAEQEAGATP